MRSAPEPVTARIEAVTLSWEPFVAIVFWAGAAFVFIRLILSILRNQSPFISFSKKSSICELLKDGEVASYRGYSRKDDGSTIMKHHNGKGDSDALGHRISNAFGQVIEVKAAPIYATGHVTYDDTSHLPMSSSMYYVSTDGTVKGWYESDYGYTYIFGSHGNWIRRITRISSAGIPLRVTERTIEY